MKYPEYIPARRRQIGRQVGSTLCADLCTFYAHHRFEGDSQTDGQNHSLQQQKSKKKAVTENFKIPLIKWKCPDFRVLYYKVRCLSPQKELRMYGYK